MENQAQSKSIILNNGLYLGIVSILISLTLYATGNLISLGWVAGVGSLIAMIVFIILGIKKFKHENGTFLSFGQALKIGVGIAMVSAVIGILYNVVFMNFIEPDFQNQVLEVQRQAWQDANMTTEQIEAAEGMAKTFSGFGMQTAFSILGAAFFGFVFSAIAGAVMRKSEDE